MIALRPATEADLDFLFELHKGSLERIVRKHREWRDADERRHLATRIAQGNDRIVLAGEEPIGHFSVTSDGNTAHIGMLAVIPQWQRRGVARRLVTDLLNTHSAITLDVHTNNKNAIAAYSRLGFRQTGEIGFKYQMALRVPA